MNNKKTSNKTHFGSNAKKKKRVPTVCEVSAGGVVFRKRQDKWHIAILKTKHVRGEVWVLPKGHVEYDCGEKKETAAIREVKEELGIKDVKITQKIGTVGWQFMGQREQKSGFVRADDQKPKKGRKVRVAKTVHHYMMEGLSDQLKPQKEEGFIDAKWVPAEEAIELLTYPTDREMVKKAYAIKKKQDQNGK